MASPVRHFDASVDEARLLDVVRTLVSELGHKSALSSVNLSAHLDRELGLGSLERVELLLRLEKAFGTRLDESVLAEAETVQDLAVALSNSDKTALLPGSRTEISKHTPPTASHGLAEGIPAAETLLDVLRHRGRIDAAQRHLIFYEDEGESGSLTFGELLAGAERVAAELARRGIGHGDRVALMLPTSPEFYLTFAGTLLAGAAPVPIYPPFRADRIAEYSERQSAILANAGARILITFQQAERVAKLLKPRVASLEAVVTASSLLESHAPAPIGRQGNTQANDLAFLQYTSGSTGHPKGVMLSHANLLANVRAIGEAVGLRADDVGVSWLPLYHDMGLIGAWLLPLYYGLPVVILSPLAFLSRPARWLWAFHRYRGTVGAAPNFAYELAATKISEDELHGLDLSSWRAALNGAEPVLPATLGRFASRFGPYGFRHEALLPVYGLAEASLAVTIPPVGRGPLIDRIDRATFQSDGRALPAPSGDVIRPADSDLNLSECKDTNVISFVTAGRPVPRHEVRIADGKGEDVGERIEGQLWFRGPSATKGYYQNEMAISALFPMGPDEGWVNSGDRAYRAEGEIYITGRVKDIIIHAGHNLYPHEIEDVVARVKGVRKGCVVVFGATNSDTGTERLVVVAEAREEGMEARARIAQEITAQVSYEIGTPPDVVKIISPHTIPKTSSGKLQRDATKKLYLSGELDSKRPPAWLQIARLAAASSIGRIRGALRGAVETIYGVYALILFGLLLFPTWLLVLIAPSRKIASRITKAAMRLYLMLAGWRVRVEGREYLKPDAPRMYVANHTSYTDILIVIAMLGGDYHFVAKSEVGSMLLFRTFLRKLGHFSFDRENPQARLRQAEEIEQALRRGESVFVFPEGTFTAQSGVREFHLGAFKAAIAAQRPIVPVALCGTRRALRDGTWLPRRGRITLTICPPILAQSDASDWQEIVRVRDAARKIISSFAKEPLL